MGTTLQNAPDTFTRTEWTVKFILSLVVKEKILVKKIHNIAKKIHLISDCQQMNDM